MREVLQKDLRQIQELVMDIFALEDEISHVKRLGGMTNHTYAVEVKGKKLLVRLPGEGTEQLLNRNDERISNELASKIGVDTELIYFNSETGVKIASYI